MKKSFFTPLTGVLAVFLFVILIISCAGGPEGRQDSGNDIWSMLRRQDPGVRDFFIGEFDVNAVDENGRTPLHYAVENGNAQLAAFFLTIGANPNALDFNRESPLGISLTGNDTVISEMLVNAGANIHLPIRADTTAARIALTKNQAVFRSILTPSTLACVDAEGRNILILAAIEGNARAVNDILAIFPSGNVSINKTDNHNRNALDYSLSRPQLKNDMLIAEQLILSGANSENHIFYHLAPAVRSGNFDVRRVNGFAPIHFAVRENYIGLIEFLFHKNINVNIQSTSGSTPLHEAARTGNIRVMTMLLDRGADVNAADALGNTALHMGVPDFVHRDVISLLLSRDANPNLRDGHGDTPLHVVIILNRSADIIQTLLGGGSDVHIRNIQGKTPLYVAVQERRTDLIPLLLSYGSEIFAADNSGTTPFTLALRDDNIFELLVSPETVNQRDGAGNTMLHSAIRNRGIPRHIGIILDNRVLVDARNRDGDTALHIAVRLNQRENGEFLISRGASIFALNAAGESPLFIAFTASTGMRQWIINPNTIIARDGLGNNMLHYAAQWNHVNAIPIIIQRGVPVDLRNATGETPLFMATRTNSLHAMELLITNNANIAANDNQGNTLLHTAVRWNAIDAAYLLISSGIDLNAHSLNGCTALHNAVALGMSDIETMLINNGANLEARDMNGNTPFMIAVTGGIISSIQRLAANRADINTRNIRGDTPLHATVAMEHYELVNMLLGMGSSIHARNNSNRTPFQNAFGVSTRMVSFLLGRDRINHSDDMGNSALHIALQEKASADAIRAILNMGARINTIDARGQTPLRLAVEMNLLDAAKIIADAGGDPFIAAADNMSPSDIAFLRSEAHVRALFSGPAINARDSSANTALHLAARSGSPQIIATLLELGANKTLRNTSAEIPADIALRWGRSENAELLRTGS